MTFEEMKVELYRRDEETLNYTPSDEYCEGVHDGLHEAAKLVSVTDPVKHGRWKYEERNCGVRSSVFALFCSECDGMSVVASVYCPYCGSLMDGGEDG